MDRGCTPNNAVPYSYKPHWAQYTDPDDNQTYSIIVVPSAMGMSWRDGESCYDTADMQVVAEMAVRGF